MGNTAAITVEKILPANTGQIWAQVEPWVLDAIGADKAFLPADIKHLCESGVLHLWVIRTPGLKGFITASVTDAPQGKICYAPWLGGKDLNEWVQPGFEILKKWVKAQGCISFSWVGRKAWHKLIKADYEGVFYLINL